MPPRYMRLDTGRETTADDPLRGIWYSAGHCGYWTDDWNKVAQVKLGGIPTCPHCSAVGLQIDAENWFDGSRRFEERGNPRYQEFLRATKEKCEGREAGGYVSIYHRFMESSNARSKT